MSAKPSKSEKNESGAKPEDKPKDEKVLPDQATEIASTSELAMGDLVITSAKKIKDALNEQKGKIIGMLSKQYKVEMTTGSSRGEVKKFDKAAVRKQVSDKLIKRIR